jgi:hypothetical protein
MPKLKFILLFVILISIISVALAETNQSTTADTEAEQLLSPSVMALVLSFIFVAISFLLDHYMDDHDAYARRLRRLQYYCMSYKTIDEPCNYMNSIEKNKTKNDKEILDDCIRFRIALIHFGSISLILMACFFVAIFIATYLMINLIPYCEPSLRNTNLLVVLIILIVNLILLSQLWIYSKQGNRIARWIKELQKIKFDKCCQNQKYLENIIIPRSRIEERLTKMRLWLARVDYDVNPDLYTSILFLFLILMWVFCIIFFCFCG